MLGKVRASYKKDAGERKDAGVRKDAGERKGAGESTRVIVSNKSESWRRASDVRR
jgi:hypothetical protein